MVFSVGLNAGLLLVGASSVIIASVLLTTRTIRVALPPDPLAGLKTTTLG